VLLGQVWFLLDKCVWGVATFVFTTGLGLPGAVGLRHHPAMPEKSREAWEVSLASLQDHRKIATIGVSCNGCGHKHSWPIEDLIERHKPWDACFRPVKAVAVLEMRLTECVTLRDRAAVEGPRSDYLPAIRLQ
jgi:hypothetical protein